MSVKVRLARAGGKKKPFFRVVVTDSRNPRDGRFIENIGVYNPTTQPLLFKIDDERLKYWLSQGATASETISRLLLKQRREQARASA